MRDANGVLIPFVVAARQPADAAASAAVLGAGGARAAAASGGRSRDARDEGEAAADWRVFGPLAPFVSRDRVTDVFVNGVAGLWVDDGGGPRRDAGWACNEDAVRDLAVRLIAQGGRHVDESKL